MFHSLQLLESIKDEKSLLKSVKDVKGQLQDTDSLVDQGGSEGSEPGCPRTRNASVVHCAQSLLTKPTMQRLRPETWLAERLDERGLSQDEV
jgi:hypothetical protein